MVIAQLGGGLGNQFCQYVAGRLLAIKLNTELKLDVSYTRISHEDKIRSIADYRLGAFNILENFATPEEIKRVKETGLVSKPPLPSMENFKGDVYIYGQWPRSEKYFIDIIDIVRKEFTLKKPFSPSAEKWKQKILSAECAVSMHFRHGDFVYNPNLIDKKNKTRPWFNITPLNYYYTCIDILKHRYGNLTVFVFSNNIQWLKENLRLDVPVEFVEGCETDDEEWILMSMCKHNINPNSSFSETSVSLNSNPDKKIFSPRASNAEGVRSFISSLTPAKKDFLLNYNGWIGIPFDFDNQPEITLRPIFSLLLVVNNDAATISETLESIFRQDYKYYEVIIIDNASIDGSSKICQKVIADKENVTFKKLWTKVKNAKAWNIALDIAQGEYISFLKGNDRFLANALTALYLINPLQMYEIIHLFFCITENVSGNITLDGKKYSDQCDAHFVTSKSYAISKDGQNAVELLLSHQINRFLGTKIYQSSFLADNKIKFDESLSDEAAELYFQMECFFKSRYFMYAPNALYIAPTPKPPVADKEVAPTPKPPTTDKAVAPAPKPPTTDKEVAPTPKPPTTDKEVAPAPKPPTTDKEVAPTPKPPTTDKEVAPTPKPPTTDKAVAPALKPTVNENIDSQIISKFNRYFTARIDVKFLSNVGNFQILSASDDGATIRKPKWFQKDGIGYQIQSYTGKLDLVAKTTVDGSVRLLLRGLDVRDTNDKSKLVPYWIDYTKLTVNGKMIFDTLTPAWHDKPYRYNINVKAGEEIKIQVEWLPHRSDT